MGRLSRKKIRFFRKCYFCETGTKYIDYKNFDFLKTFFTLKTGHIKAPIFTGTCAKCQRKLVKAIKISRELGFLPFVETD